MGTDDPYKVLDDEGAAMLTVVLAVLAEQDKEESVDDAVHRIQEHLNSVNLGGSHQRVGGRVDQDHQLQGGSCRPEGTSSAVRCGHAKAQAMPPFSACVARPIKPAEVRTNPRARVVMDAEWARLRAVPRRDGKKGVWDEDLVQDWSAVRHAARQRDEKVHVGIVFGLV